MMYLLTNRKIWASEAVVGGMPCILYTSQQPDQARI
jgi:hypothetical protein